MEAIVKSRGPAAMALQLARQEVLTSGIEQCQVKHDLVFMGKAVGVHRFFASKDKIFPRGQGARSG